MVHQIGLDDPEAVSLVLAPDVPEDVRARVSDLAAEIVAGKIEVSVDYDGPEFHPETRQPKRTTGGPVGPPKPAQSE